MRHHGSFHSARWVLRGTVAILTAAVGVHASHLLSGEGGGDMSTEDLAAAGGSTTSGTNPLDLIHKTTGLTPVELVVLLVVLVVVLIGVSVVLPSFSRARAQSR